ncbi:MAG: hypothetical protein HQ577_04830 [Dehalococcoidia bacterium]|nr:hypothetical protein [Dehalococcoidia bacterium]
MFKLLGRKRGEKGAGPAQVEENQRDEAVVDEGNGERLVEKVGDLVEQHGVSSAASVRSIIKAAISSAEQIVDSVKTQVVVEARQEAAKIITEAKNEADKINGGKAPLQEEAAEEIIAGSQPVAEDRTDEPVITEEDAVALKEEEAIQIQEKIEEPVAEETAPQEEETAATETVAGEALAEEAVAEEKGPEKAGKKEWKAPKKQHGRVATMEESRSLYTGEVDLSVEVPVEPTMVASLYSYLQTTPEIKFVRTTGSWNKGSTITVVLDKPIPLISELASRLPEADILPERPDVSGHVRDRRGMRRISISLKD